MPRPRPEPSLLDAVLPAWHFREVHRRRVAAPPERALEIGLGIRLRDAPLSAVLMALRVAPGALFGERLPFRPGTQWLDLFEELGLVELAREPREAIIGGIGRFWRLRERLQPVGDAEAFARFDHPGFAKGAVNFRAEAAGGGSLVQTETRVLATDEAARRIFRRYWVSVRAGGGLMRRELLWAIARRAQRG